MFTPVGKALLFFFFLSFLGGGRRLSRGLAFRDLRFF
jgi:hypothetical protein